MRNGIYSVETGDRIQMVSVQDGEIVATRSNDPCTRRGDFMTDSLFSRAWGMHAAGGGEHTTKEEDDFLSQRFPGSQFELMYD